jgi:hypothetical protein
MKPTSRDHSSGRVSIFAILHSAKCTRAVSFVHLSLAVFAIDPLIRVMEEEEESYIH